MTSKEKKTGKQEIVNDSLEEVLKNNDEVSERINKLYGLSNNSFQKETREYDPNELVEVRKKLVFLLGGVVLSCMIILFLLISPLFNNKNENLGSSTNTENNNNEEETIEENDYIGELDLTDKLILELSNKFSFTTEDFKDIDLFPLYNSESLNASDIPNNIKLYLLKRDTKFMELLVNNGIDDYINTCDSSVIVIDKIKFDELVSTLFGPNFTIEYTDINYIYYNDDVSKKITLSYIDNKYVVKCNEYLVNDNITKYVQQELIKAIGTESSIELYQKVVFISQQGVFKDPSMQNLITNDKDATFDEYMDKGNTYKYIFTKSEDGYYLSKIELVKEDN